MSRNKKPKKIVQTQQSSKEEVKVAGKNAYESFIQGKEFYLLTALMILACFFVFKDFFYLMKVYLFRDIGSDSLNIYLPWLINYSEIYKVDGVPGWSFAQGMGQNVFPIWLGDFFSNFLMLFDKSKIPYGLAWTEASKIFLAGLVFYKFLKELRLSSFSALPIAMFYAFSGFMIVGGSWFIFSAEALYVAIILYGFERWLNHQKYFWLVIGIACLGFLQPFLLMPYTLFLAAYILARYLDVHEKLDKSFFIFILKTIGFAALGVAISSYQFLPDLLQYLESPRVGGDSSFFAKLQAQPVFGLANEELRFTTTFRAFGSDMLGNGSKFKGWQNYLEAPLFYCGIICLVVFPQFFVSLSKRQKIVYGIITGIFCLPMVFPYFRFAFWAFSGDYFRTYSLLIILFLTIFSARAISYIEQNNQINKIVLGVTVLVLLVLLYTPSEIFEPAVNTSLRTTVTFLIFAYSALLMGTGSKSSFKPVLKIVFIALCLFEVIFFASKSVNQREVVTDKMLNSKIGYNDYTLEAVEYLKEIDQSFYRVNKDYSSGLAMHSSINDAKVQGFNGTSSYYSFNQQNYIKFLGDLNVIDVKNENDTRWARGLGGRPVLFSLASGKYWLSKRTDNAIKGMGFDSIAQFADVRVYRNNYALPFGFCYDQIIGEDDFKNISPSRKDFCLLRACVIENNDSADFSTFAQFNLADTITPLTFDNYLAFTSELKKDTLSISKFSNNHIVGSLAVKAPKVLFFSIPFDEGWCATVNDQEVPLYRINAGLTGLLLMEGANTIELHFEPRLRKTGANITISSLLILIGLLSFSRFTGKKEEA